MQNFYHSETSIDRTVIDSNSLKSQILYFLIDLIDNRNKFNFNFKLKFLKSDSNKKSSNQSSENRVFTLPCNLVEEEFSNEDPIKHIHKIYNLIKNYILNLNFNSELISKVKNEFLVEFIQDLDQNEKENFKNSIDNAYKYSELVSNELFNDSFNIINKYDQFAQNVINQLFDEFKNEKNISNYKENEFEIKIPIPNTDNLNNLLLNNSFNNNNLNRRHSDDLVTKIKNNREMHTKNLPNITEHNLNEPIIDFSLRRHSLNTSNSLVFNQNLNTSHSVNKLNRSFMSHSSKPTIIIDYEDENDSRLSCDSYYKSVESDLDVSDKSFNSDKIITNSSNNQFKQYTKVTLKSILNKSPNSSKISNQTQGHFLLNDNFAEANIKNSSFLNRFLNETFTESFDQVKSIMIFETEYGKNLSDLILNITFDEVLKIKKLNKVNHLIFECKCKKTKDFKNNKINESQSFKCRTAIYLILLILDEFDFRNRVTLICSYK